MTDPQKKLVKQWVDKALIVGFISVSLTKQPGKWLNTSSAVFVFLIWIMRPFHLHCFHHLVFAETHRVYRLRGLTLRPTIRYKCRV